MFARLIYILTYPWKQYKIKRDLKRKLKKLREQDPFIYE